MNGSAIRPYEHADFDTVTAIWADGAPAPDAAARADILRALRERLPQELARGWTVHVATVAGAVQGFLALHEKRLEQLYIAPAMQGRGIGKLLLDFAKTSLPGGFWLTTAPDNEGAMRFYDREGLRRIGRVPHPHDGRPVMRYEWAP